MLEAEKLVAICVDVCVFSQDHSAYWDKATREKDLPFAMEHVSYVIACYLAQNTRLGASGIDWDIVHKELCGPVLTRHAWREIIAKLVADLNKD